MLTRAFACLIGLAVLVSGCDPFHTGFEDFEDARYYEKNEPGPVPDPKPVLRAMNYNVKFGGGRIDFFFDCFGNRVLMTKDEVRRNLERLAAKDPRIARIVECRYFAGLSEEETAEALGMSLRTAQREWKRARAWLREALSEPGGAGV